MTPVRTVETRKISNTSQMRKNPGKMVGEADTPRTMTNKGKRVCKITETLWEELLESKPIN